ncbi:hypothetical protein WAF17_21105 [Bernardetia sp. ABR2-2B]|uniref:hypothetical protein n=1 Tax=Bernardetia sp. ABR2-2B TaxID=3127472 RepID=UPI0030D60627
MNLQLEELRKLYEYLKDYFPNLSMIILSHNHKVEKFPNQRVYVERQFLDSNMVRLQLLYTSRISNTRIVTELQFLPIKSDYSSSVNLDSGGLHQKNIQFGLIDKEFLKEDMAHREVDFLRKIYDKPIIES